MLCGNDIFPDQEHLSPFSNAPGTRPHERPRLDLVFSDFNRVEKVAPLGRALTLRGVPDADAPAPGEIGYYAPTRGLVLYYGHVGRSPGLVRMGRFMYDLQSLREMPNGTRIQIASVPTRIT